MGKGLVKFFLDCWASIRRTLPSHLLLYVCTFAFGAISLGIAGAYHVRLSIFPSMVLFRIVPTYLLIVVFLVCLFQYAKLLGQRSTRPLQAFGSWLRNCAVANDQVGNAFHTLLTLIPLLVTFLALKVTIPLIHPFAWDETLAQWDRILGFGIMPWEVLQRAFGTPPVTRAIDVIYASWFFVMWGVFFWQAFFALGTALRMQFLLAFALSWFVGGNVLALFFSSAGPCFYGYLYTPDPFAEQMAYLRAVNESWPLWTIQIQDLLWNLYENDLNIGISAMPSLHVVNSVLMALLGWRTNKWLGAGLTAFAVVIVLGSVHLAWHYAVDSIAGVGLAVLFWSSAGLILRWQAWAGGANWVVPAPASGEAAA